MQHSLAATVARASLMGCLGLLALLLCGCGSDQTKENQRLLEQQQTQIDQLQQEIAAVQTTQASSTTAVPTGACDEAVMREATRKAGERFAANDLRQALGYYQDAVTACPQSPRAQLNLGHVYEAMSDVPEATAHYKQAADASGPPADPDAVAQARTALVRLQK